MNLRKIVAVLLLVAGVLALVYRGFSYTAKRREAKIGPFELAVQSRDRVELPVWLGVVLIAGGGALLLFDRK